MNVQSLVEYINARHNTNFILRERYATGENQGAYGLTDGAGAGYVLKWNTRPAWLRSIHRAQQITNHLAPRGMPVPQYVLADTRTDTVTYWIQTALPGTPPEALSRNHLQQLLDFIELEAGQAFTGNSNWSAYVLAVVFLGESGWQNSLEQYSDETRTVLERLRQVVAGKEQTRLREDDISHGDMGLDNVLVEGSRVTGIVDWDAAGNGDRALDLSKLIFYSYSNAAIREPLRGRMVEISGLDAYTIYLAYNILAQLDWSIHHHPAEAVTEAVALAHHILADLEAPL